MEQINIQSPKIQKGVFWALVILCVFLAVKTLGELRAYPTIGVEPGQNVITVSGKGEVFASANIANFTFGVDTEGATVADAQKKASEIASKAVDLLKKSGIDEKDIKTTNYNVGPKYEYETRPCTAYSCPPANPKITGYQVNEYFSVKVRDIDKAGSIISDLGETGVSNLSSLDFTVDDEDFLQEEARSLAIKDAHEKAEKLADDLDVSLGKVLSFNEDFGGYPVPMYVKGMGGSMESASDTVIEKGENKVAVTVTVTYRIR